MSSSCGRNILSISHTGHDQNSSNISVPLLQISAQFPVFAVLEKQDQGVYNGSVDVKIESTAVALNESRLSTLAAFIAALPRVAGHSEGCDYLQSICFLNL